MIVPTQPYQPVPTQAGPAMDSLLQYGAIGALLVLTIIALVMLYRRIIANADAERLRADAERERSAALEVELRELNQRIQDKVLSTLAEATHAIGDVINELRRRP